ncbi:MAG: restriction endonuclease, partial [Candidatus Binatia bacterium]
MDEFDLGRLTDYDFEKVCKDIFEEYLQVQLELFAPGADGGVDLRHYRAIDDTTVIIQCKHWAKSGRSKLVRHYEMHEAEKVTRLAPGRYLLATTAELTPPAKGKLAKALQGYLQSTGDIFGLNEIAAFLESHRHIVARHLRLWLTSAAVLRGVLNRDIQHRSRTLAEDIEESLRVFVPNPSYDDAHAILDREHACIISGI